MEQLILGGAVGAIFTGLLMGLLLWYERDRRAKWQAAAVEYEDAYVNQISRSETLEALVKEKNARIELLETLVPTDALFDELFGRSGS